MVRLNVRLVRLNSFVVKNALAFWTFFQFQRIKNSNNVWITFSLLLDPLVPRTRSFYCIIVRIMSTLTPNFFRMADSHGKDAHNLKPNIKTFGCHRNQTQVSKQHKPILFQCHHGLLEWNLFNLSPSSIVTLEKN